MCGRIAPKRRLQRCTAEQSRQPLRSLYQLGLYAASSDTTHPSRNALLGIQLEGLTVGPWKSAGVGPGVRDYILERHARTTRRGAKIDGHTR